MQDAINKINEFVDHYNISDVDDEFLNLLIAAMNSEEANHWDEKKRSNVLFFYKMVINVIRSIYVIAPAIEEKTVFKPKGAVKRLKTA